MTPTASQIGAWLAEQRVAAGLTQETAARDADVGLGVVAKAEAGRDLRVSNFLALVVAYGAEDALARQIEVWRNTRGPSKGTATHRVAKSAAADEGKGGKRRAS